MIASGLLRELLRIRAPEPVAIGGGSNGGECSGVAIGPGVGVR